MKYPEQQPGDDTINEFESNAVEGIREYNYAAKVKERLVNIGLCYDERPQLSEEHRNVFPGLEPGQYFDGRLPTVIRNLSLEQLSALYSLFSNWFSYIHFQLKMIAAERSEAKKHKEFMWSHVRKRYKKIDPDTGKMVSDQATSDRARIDYRFIQVDAKYEELNAVYSGLLVLCEVAEQNMQVISREVTIHQMIMGKGAGMTHDPVVHWSRPNDEDSSAAPEARFNRGNVRSYDRPNERGYDNTVPNVPTRPAT
jgi:hypothetical protein